MSIKLNNSVPDCVYIFIYVCMSYWLNSLPAGDFTLSTLFQVKLCLCSLFDLIKSNYPCDTKLSSLCEENLHARLYQYMLLRTCIHLKNLSLSTQLIAGDATLRFSETNCVFVSIVKHSVKSFGRYQVVVTTVPGWGNMFNNFIKPSPGSHKLIILWAGCASISFSEMI